MENNYFRVKPHIMMLDEKNISPPVKNHFTIIDNYLGLMHVGDGSDGFILSYLTEPRRPQELLEHCKSNHEFDNDSEKMITDKLHDYLHRNIVEESAEPFKECHEKAILSVGGAIERVDSSVDAQTFPWTIAFVPTSRCNLRCRHCLADRGKHPSVSKELTMEEILNLFNELEENALGELRISGGEPFVRLDALNIIKEAAKKRFKLAVFTNCFTLNNETVESFKDIQNKKNLGFKVHYSIDGASSFTHDWFRRRKGAFKNLIHSLRLLHKAGIRLVAEVVLHRKNLNELEKICKIAADYGTISLSFHPAYYIGRALKSYEKDLLLSPEELTNASDILWKCKLRHEEKMAVDFTIIDLPMMAFLSEKAQRRQELFAHGKQSSKNNCQKLVPYRCSAGNRQMFIDYDGTVYPCPNYVDMPKFAMGNIKHNTIRQIWLSDKWKFFRGGWSYSDLLVCKHCKYQPSCNLPQICRALPAAAYDDPCGPSPLCSIYKHKFNLDVPEMGVYAHNE